MSRESISLRGPTEVVDCLANAWPLKLATKGATRSKLICGAILDFDLVEAWDGTVGGTACKGGMDISLARMISYIGCM
jgi:hypothetical protein